jgi:hypothetical protein
MQITDPGYISQRMFDAALQSKFIDNVDDAAVRQQAVTLLHLFRNSATHSQVLADVLHAARISRRTSVEQVAEIAFAMGMQFGFEMALTYPPK